MSVSGSGDTEITRLLRAWSSGDAAALDLLAPRVQEELHRIARRYMSRERPGHTLQATALIHEAYLRLIDGSAVTWQDRAHFYAVASQTMRRIVVDAARARSSVKRGGRMQREEHGTAFDFDQVADLSGRDRDVLRLNDALEALVRFDERKARVVELRFFGGLSVEETAEVIGMSPQSVMRDWKLAKAWLASELAGPPADPSMREASRKPE